MHGRDTSRGGACTTPHDDALRCAGAGNNPGRSGRTAAQPAGGMLHLFVEVHNYPEFIRSNPLCESYALFAAILIGWRLASKLGCWRYPRDSR